MSLQTVIPALALKLINKFGTSATYSFITTGTYDATTSAVSNTTVSQSIKCIPEDYSEGLRVLQSFGIGFSGGAAIAEGDKKVMIAAKGLNGTPNAGDTILFNSVLYNITNKSEVYAQNALAIYSLHVRKA